jgi:hypothetical protein
MKECKACGARNLDSHEYCGICRRRLDGQETAVIAPAKENVKKRMIRLSTTGVLISLICGFISLVTAVLVSFLVPSWVLMGEPMGNLFTIAMASGIATIVLSLIALRERQFGIALLSTLASLSATWASFGIFLTPVAIAGLILVIIAKDEF